MFTRILNRFGITIRRVEEVVPGDVIRFSTILIEEIQALPQETSYPVEVKEIKTTEDGTKVLYLSNVTNRKLAN